jgi:hypothetical protein
MEVALRLSFLALLALALLAVAAPSFAQQPQSQPPSKCLSTNQLPGYSPFCLTTFEKGVTMTEPKCKNAKGDHLKFQCTSGRNNGRNWDIWCWHGDMACNVNQLALCTYDTYRMNGANEWNPGEHCTQEIK